jgi:hypothetical protein
MILQANNKLYSINLETIYKWGSTKKEHKEFIEHKEEQLAKMIDTITKENEKDVDDFMDSYLVELSQLVFTDLYHELGRTNFNKSFLLPETVERAEYLIHDNLDKVGINLDTAKEIECVICKNHDKKMNGKA